MVILFGTNQPPHTKNKRLPLQIENVARKTPPSLEVNLPVLALAKLNGDPRKLAGKFFRRELQGFFQSALMR